MAQWQQIQQKPRQLVDQIQKLYRDAAFPIEVRHFFAEWIEQQCWKDFVKEEPEHVQLAKQLLEQLLIQMKDKLTELHEDQYFPIRLKLEEAENNFTQFYGCNPFAFIDVMKKLLQDEANLIEAHEQNNVQHIEMNEFVEVSRAQEITQQLECLKQRTQETDSTLRELICLQESFIIKYQECAKLENLLKQIQAQPQKTAELQKQEEIIRKNRDTCSALLSQMVQTLQQNRSMIAEKYSETLHGIEVVQKTVVDEELIRWRRQQNIGEHSEGSLDQIQNWCEDLADLNWTNRQQIQRCRQVQAQLELPHGQTDTLPELGDQITSLLSHLVTSTFIVSKQPPQVLKKDSRFSASIRLLVGGKLNVHMTNPSVKANIISEKQAQDILKNDMKAKNETSGEILNNTGTMDYDSATRKLGITFRNMQLKRIKRTDKKTNEAVTEEKFCIFFQSDFQLGVKELFFQVWTLSLPVVVIVHGNQECNAHATILWDNAFSEPGRIPFHVPDQVTWSQLTEQLDLKFKSITGRGLTQDHLSYLATKLFDTPASEDVSNRTVTWSLFNKEQLKGRPFTFWEWLYSVAKLIKDHLKEPWNDGSVIGFISKQQAQEWLFTKPNGTFLLRFSDSEAGGITIAWVDDKASGKQEVWNLKPFGAKDFSIRSLADRIKDLPNLVYLYPDIPKETAFGKYFSNNSEKSTPNSDGYIKPNLKVVIPERYNGHTNTEMMTIPQVMEPFSPATSATSTYDRCPNSVLTQQSIEELMPYDNDEMFSISTDYIPDDFTLNDNLLKIS